jgi:methylglutaconyl-CoA hydratase
MEFTRITYGAADRRALITLRRPGHRNTLDDAMVRELTAAVTAAAKDPAVKCLLMTGAGEDFCAGADLEQLGTLSQADLETNRSESFRLANLYRLLYEIRKPVIALVNGPALGGGCGLASACDFVLAAREASRFGYPEVRIGFIPAIVLVFLVKRVGEGRARELVLRGNVLDAPAALHAGLVSAVVPDAGLLAAGESLAAELASSNSGHAMGLCKDMLAKLPGMNLLDALDFAANMHAAARMSQDCKAGVAASLNNAPIAW